MKHQARGIARAHESHGSEVRKPLVEARTGHEVESDGSRVRVRRAVCDEHECRPSVSLDLDLFVEARVALAKRVESATFMNVTSPGLRPSGLRPSSSTLRTDLVRVEPETRR